MKKAGFHLILPIIDYVGQIHATSTTLDVPGQRVATRDQRVLVVDSNIVYRVTDVKKAAVEIDDVPKGVNTVVGQAVFDVVSSRTYAELGDRDSLDAALRDALAPVLAHWGVIIERVGLNSMSPEGVTIKLTQLRETVAERSQMFKVFREAGYSERRSLELVGARVELVEPFRAQTRGNEGPEERQGDENRRRRRDPIPWKNIAAVVAPLVLLGAAAYRFGVLVTTPAPEFSPWAYRQMYRECQTEIQGYCTEDGEVWLTGYEGEPVSVGFVTPPGFESGSSPSDMMLWELVHPHWDLEYWDEREAESEEWRKHQEEKWWWER